MAELLPPQDNPFAPVVHLVHQQKKRPWIGEDYFRPPRLGIIHLLAWITVSAALLGWSEVLQNLDIPEPAVSRQLRWRLFSSLHIFIIAAEFVGLGVILRGWIRGEDGRWQPGHFLIAIHAVIHGLYGLLFTGLILRSYVAWSKVVQLYGYSHALLNILQVGLFLWCAFRLPEPRRWRGLFAMVAVLSILTCCFRALPVMAWGVEGSLISNIFRNFLFMGLYLITAIRDLKLGPRRDWVHWLGALTPVCIYALSVLSVTIWMLLGAQ